MNARWYDPLLHRFLSPDDYVQDPTNTQNFNRYGYVLNNPLIYTDQSGNLFGIDDAFAMLIGGSINLISNIGNIHGLGSAIGYFAVGAISTEITYATGGAGAALGGSFLSMGNNLISQVSQNGRGSINVKQLLISGVTGAIISGAGSILGNAIAPGISNFINDRIVSPVISHALINGISGAAVGSAIGAGAALFTGDNVLRSALGGAASGAEMGLLSGAAEGIKFAKDSGIGMWSGRSEEILEQPKFTTDVQISDQINFSKTPAEHMENPDRYVPVRILQEGILSTPGVPDPRGSSALMHHTIMWKNETPYNLEILYHKGTNTIYHFKYSHIKNK